MLLHLIAGLAVSVPVCQLDALSLRGLHSLSIKKGQRRLYFEILSGFLSAAERML